MNLRQLVNGFGAAFTALRKSWSGPAFPGTAPVTSWPFNWWQYNNTTALLPDDFSSFGPVQTCINIISQDLSRLPLRHVEIGDSGARRDVRGRAPMRVFRGPNAFQTRSDFLLYKARSLLSDGNSYNLALRNERNEVRALYPLPPWSVYPYVTPEEGEVVYRVSHSQVLDVAQPDFDNDFWVPARNMLHIRLQTPKNPLIGESPLVAALYPAITGAQINRQAATFFSNMSRPGGVLRHPGELSETAMARLKTRFKELTSGDNSGEVAILLEGMEWQQIQMTAVDAELARIYQLSERQIFQLFRIPPFLGGDLDKSGFQNVESLTRFYFQSCLGFYVNHIQEALTRFFGLPDNEAIVFDLDQALLAGDIKERLEALGKGVQNGIYAPNEARALENLPPVENGDEPRVQQQLVPLSFGANLQEAPVPVPSPGRPVENEDEEDDSAEEGTTSMSTQDMYQQLRKVVYV